MTDFAIRKIVALVPGEDTVLVAYMLLPGSGAARLTIRPLLAFRDFHALTHTNGAANLRATIGNTSDPAADLDLFIFDCTSGSCSLAAQAADGDSEESATIQNPKAGTYIVLVDGYAVPSGSTTFDYVDVFTSPSFGKVDVSDENVTRTADATWTVPGTVTAGAVPAAGRVLLGAVQVRTDENVLVGTGDVVVQNVTP